jgi:VIT1/CCC1 family predicted Fe2+/Mn2+ transporter
MSTRLSFTRVCYALALVVFFVGAYRAHGLLFPLTALAAGLSVGLLGVLITRSAAKRKSDRGG